MIIRPLRKDEAHKAKALMGCAFNYSVDVQAEVASLLDEEFIGAFCDDGETLMAQVAVKPYKSVFCGVAVDCVGIAGVSTYPEYRRNGCVKVIFNEIFRLAPEREWAVSFLYPFSYRYYRKFGYEVAIRHKKLTVPFEMITHIERNSKAVLYSGQPEVLEGLLAVYNEYALSRNVCFIRDDGREYPQDPIKSQKYTYLWYDGSEPKAYAKVKPGQDRALEVEELVYTSTDSLKGILGFLRLYDGQFKRLSIPYLEYDSPVDYLLDDDRDIGIGCFDGAQGRIIDITKILRLNRYPEGKGELRIKLYGDFFAENNGIYGISYEDGKGKASFSKDGEYDIALNIQSLSRLVFGDVPEYAIPYLPGIIIQNENKLKKLARCFPKRPINLFEKF